jgi:hypothetical protein
LFAVLSVTSAESLPSILRRLKTKYKLVRRDTNTAPIIGKPWTGTDKLSATPINRCVFPPLPPDCRELLLALLIGSVDRKFTYSHEKIIRKS